MGSSYYTDSDIAALPNTSLLKKYASSIHQIAAQTSPYPQGTTGFDTFLGECQAWLPTRNINYFKKTAGDCPPFVSSGANPVLLGPQGGVAALQVSGAIASNLPTIGASSIAKAVPIVGDAIGAVIGIFTDIVQHHAIAVKAEQDTLCNVAAAFNSVIGSIDSAVYYGQASVAQGVDAVRNIATQLKASIDQSIKNEVGNSGSNYKGILDAQVLFAQLLYTDISPKAQIAAPGTPSNTAPANADQAIANFTSSLGVGTGSPAVSSISGPSWEGVALIAAVVVVAILLVKK